MATNFPNSLDDSTSLPYPSSTDDTNSPSLAGGQDNQNDAVIAVETKLGITDSNAQTPTEGYLLAATADNESSWSIAYPASTIVGISDSQTLTNKTLTSPTINTPTINNPTLKTDSIVGYTSSDSGTIYGISVSSSKISGSALTNASVTNAQLASNSVYSGTLGLSSSYTGGVQTFTNLGTAGGTFYYINLGGLKLMWGITNSMGSSTTGGSNTLTMPSFFSTIQYAGASPGYGTNTVQQFILTIINSTTSIGFTPVAINGSSTSVVGNVWIIGT